MLRRVVAPPSGPAEEVARAARLISELLAAGFGMGVDLDCKPGDACGVGAAEKEAIHRRAMVLPIGYYSETFHNLVIPPEEGVIGDLEDDLLDIYGDLALGS